MADCSARETDSKCEGGREGQDLGPKDGGGGAGGPPMAASSESAGGLGMIPGSVKKWVFSEEIARGGICL